MGNRSSHHRGMGIGIGNAADKIRPLRRWSLGWDWAWVRDLLLASTWISAADQAETNVCLPGLDSELKLSLDRPCFRFGFGVCWLGLPFGLSPGLLISECRQITRTDDEWQCS